MERCNYRGHLLSCYTFIWNYYLWLAGRVIRLVLSLFSLEPSLDERTTIFSNAKLLHQAASSTVIQIAFLSNITYLHNPCGIMVESVPQSSTCHLKQISTTTSVQSCASHSVCFYFSHTQSEVVSVKSSFTDLQHMLGSHEAFWCLRQFLESEFSEHRQLARVAHPTGVLKFNMSSSGHQLSPETSPISLIDHDYIVLSPWRPRAKTLFPVVNLHKVTYNSSNSSSIIPNNH